MSRPAWGDAEHNANPAENQNLGRVLNDWGSGWNGRQSSWNWADLLTVGRSRRSRASACAQCSLLLSRVVTSEQRAAKSEVSEALLATVPPSRPVRRTDLVDADSLAAALRQNCVVPPAIAFGDPL